jgi:hypothetical protein
MANPPARFRPDVADPCRAAEGPQGPQRDDVAAVVGAASTVVARGQARNVMLPHDWLFPGSRGKGDDGARIWLRRHGVLLM